MERLSSIKARQGISAQNVWLVVFPLEIQFTTAVDYPTALYFQKNYQVIGDLKSTLPPSNKNHHHLFSSPDEMITFKLFSRDNLTYKWTLYRKHDSGQQELIDNCSVDFKPSLGDLVTASRSSLLASTDSLNLIACVQKELWATFPSTGMKIRFMFYASDDLKTVEDLITNRIHTLSRQVPKAREQEATIQATTVPVENPASSEGNIEVSSKMEGENSKENPSNPEIQLAFVPEETFIEEKKEGQPKDQTTTPAQPAKPVSAEVQPLQPEPNLMKLVSFEKATSYKEEELLRMQSLQAKKTLQDNENEKKPQNLEVINQEREKLPSSSVSNPTLPEGSQPQKAEEATSQPANGQSAQGVNSFLDMKIDLKKVIILFLLAIIGFLWFQRPQEKTAPKKKNRSKKR